MTGMTGRAVSQVPPGVRMLALRTPTLPPATHTNAFVVGTADAVLIEPASPYDEEIDHVLAELEACARAGMRLRAMLVTHHHIDHVGGAARLREALGLPLWAHARTAELLEGTVVVDRHLADGERIELGGSHDLVLRAIHTPGHASGHLCFLEERSHALIAGDMVASIGTIIVGPTDGDMTLYLASLSYMRELEPSMLLPAHGDPILDPRAKIDAYIRHRLMREQKVLDALRAAGRPVTPEAIVPHAYDDTPAHVWPLATRSTMAHLIKLAREGRAEETQAGWIAV